MLIGPRALLLPVVLICAAALLPSPASGAFIDALVDELPPNPNEPSNWPVLFLDGTFPSDTAVQTGLPGVLGGGRRAELIDALPGGMPDALVEIYGPGQTLSFSSFFDTFAILRLTYGDAGDLNADISVGASALEIDLLFADMDDSMPPRPVPLTITVTSGRGTPAEVTASQTLPLSGEGTYSFPFSAFPGVSFLDVDRIVYEFDVSQVEATDWSIGPLRTNEIPVASEGTTWGRIKSRRN